MWMMLTAREVELLKRFVNGGENAAVMRTIQDKIDVVTGELTLDKDEVKLVEQAALHWRGGYEKQFKALLAAMDRHVTSGRS